MSGLPSFGKLALTCTAKKKKKDHVRMRVDVSPSKVSVPHSSSRIPRTEQMKAVGRLSSRLRNTRPPCFSILRRQKLTGSR